MKMHKGWIRLKDATPENGQKVLTYYFDEGDDKDEFSVLGYYKKGTVISTKICREGNSPEERLLKTMFDGEKIIAEEDGFYMVEPDQNGDIAYRKHADVITHWQPLVGPSQENK